MTEKPEHKPCGISRSEVSMIFFRLGEIKALVSSNRSSLSRMSRISSKEAHPTATDMRSWIKWVPDILEAAFILLRTLGPWASLALAWVAAIMVAAWKGVMPWFGSWLP